MSFRFNAVACCPVNPEHTLLYWGLCGMRGDNAPLQACQVRWSLWLSVGIFHVLLWFKQTPSDPRYCGEGLYLERAFLWSQLPSPHTFFREEQINGWERSRLSMIGIIFTYCQMEDKTRYQDLLSSFISLALDGAKIWRAHARQMLSVMDGASHSLCVKRKICLVGGISTRRTDGAYFVFV